MEITYHWEGGYLIPRPESSPIALKMPMAHFEKVVDGNSKKQPNFGQGGQRLSAQSGKTG